MIDTFGLQWAVLLTNHIVRKWAYYIIGLCVVFLIISGSFFPNAIVDLNVTEK